VAEPAENVDIETLRAVIVNRMHVLRDYTRQVTLPEFRRQKGDDPLWRRAKQLLVRQPALLDEAARDRLHSLLERNPRLATVYQFRERLRELWSGATNVSNEKLVAQLRQWCNEAEASGIKALQDFARTLRGYAIAPQPA
jgi:stearoyl-CoA desaturase (delta-9 desaturase)